MKNKNIIQIIIIITLVIILGVVVVIYVKDINSESAELSSEMQMGEPPDKPDGSGGMPGGDSNSNVSHTGATEISSDTTNSNEEYSSTTGSQNALLVTSGTSTLTNPNITKTGDSDGDNSDFYGTNAAVLVKEGTLNIKGGKWFTCKWCICIF